MSELDQTCLNIYFFFEIIFIDSDGLRQKASDLWDTIIRLETEKYDIEEKQKRQNYDVSYFLITYLKKNRKILWKKKVENYIEMHIILVFVEIWQIKGRKSIK